MKRFKYPALVVSEAKNLRKYATKEELTKLNINEFNPKSQYGCIYGLMCNTCYSKRAEELIVKSAKRVYKFDDFSGLPNKQFLSKTLNGKPKFDGRYSIDKESCELHETFFSPIEIFVYKEKNQKSGANERLIKYLKGEIKTL